MHWLHLSHQRTPKDGSHAVCIGREHYLDNFRFHLAP
jgi:hypothetical protein